MMSDAVEIWKPEIIKPPVFLSVNIFRIKKYPSVEKLPSLISTLVGKWV